MNDGWIKKFSDNTIETGSDEEIKARQASWQHGRLDGLVSVDICMNNKIVTLDADKGDWWQADTYTAQITPGQTVRGKLQSRRVMYQLTEKDVGKWIVVELNKEKAIVSIEDQKR